MASQPNDPELYYERHIFCCVNVRPDGHPRGCCSARGSVDLRNYLKAKAKDMGLKKLRVNQSGCMERCELGPTMVIYPEAVWYTYGSTDDVDEILERHIIGGETVERLRLDVDQRVPKPKVKQELKLRVTDVSDQTPAIKRFELCPANGGELPAFEAGAHIDVVTGCGRRSFSLANDPSERDRYVLGVLRETDGRGGSAWMFDVVGAGDTLTVMPPLNNFRLDPDASEHLLIAGGIGITPILAMGHALKAEGAKRTLHYCTKSVGETAFMEEVKEVFGDNVVFHHDGGDPAKGIKLDQVLGNHADGAHLYICGPSGLLEAVRSASAHWPEGSVHFELFAPSARPTPPPNEAFEIVLSRRKTTLEVPTDKSILQVVREHGLEVDSSCEDGICSTCRTRLLGGVAEHRDDVLSDSEKAENSAVMICISRAKAGEKLILDL